MRRPVVFALSALACALLFPCSLISQESPQERIRLANQRFKQQVAAKDYDAAVASISQMIEIAKAGGIDFNLAQTLYVRACLNALAGHTTPALTDVELAVKAGFKDYYQFAADRDLDSLRTEPRFRAALQELKQKYGPHPLEWDRAQSAPAFPLLFDDPKLDLYRTLRSEFALDPVATSAKGDIERLKALTLWTAAQWQHSSNQMAKSTDPIGILREARAGGRFICTNYAMVLAGVARAYGLKARVLNLMPRDVETRSEAHTVAEVWIPRWQKWVLADGQYGIIAEKDGVPLSALELQAALAAEAPVTCAGNVERCAEWKPFILRNLYYLKIADDQRSFGAKMTKQLVLVPKGAAEPHLFAGGNPEVFHGAIYTSNPESFYAPPRK